MNKFAKTSLGVVALAVVVVVAGVCHTPSRRARAGTIQLGDTKAQVERQLGRATMVTPFSPLWRTDARAALFCNTAETWAYGSRFNFRSRFPWIQVRLFLPDKANITVEFNTSGRAGQLTDYGNSNIIIAGASRSGGCGWT